MNYYEHHLGDYLRKTLQLSMLEDGAYRRLIDAYYASEAPLPADERAVCRLARAMDKAEQQAVRSVLRQFFDLREDGWHHARCDAEIAKYHGKSAKARESANARWERQRQHSEGNANAYANALRSECDPICESDALQSPVPRHQEKDTRSGEGTTAAPRPAKAAEPPEFAALWAAYPPRGGGNPRGRALKAARARIAEGATWEQLADGVARYAEFCRLTHKAGTEYVLQAATFFGPDHRYAEPWTPPASKADVRLVTNLGAAAEFLRRTEAAA